MATISNVSSHPPSVELLLDQLGAVASISPVVHRILALDAEAVEAPDVLSRAWSEDPLMAARLGGSFFPISAALERLGGRTVRRILLVRLFMEPFAEPRHPSDGPGLDRGAFWKHSLAVACAAGAPAGATASEAGPSHSSRLHAVDPEDAFLCGLLHDVGKIALDCVVPRSWSRVLRRCAQSDSPLIDVEREVLGIDHAIAGRRLAEQWGLDARVADCIRLHHDPLDEIPASSDGGLIGIVQLADAMVRAWAIGYSDGGAEPSADEIAARLGCVDALRSVTPEAVAAEVERFERWCGLKSEADRRFAAASDDARCLPVAANGVSIEASRRQARTAACLAAIAEIARLGSAPASSRALCARAAAVFHHLLSSESFDGGACGPVLVFSSQSAASSAVDAGFFDGRARELVVTRPDKVEPFGLANLSPVGMPSTSDGLMPVPLELDWLVDRFRGAWGEGEIRFLPLRCGAAWSGGILFAADAGRAASLQACATDLVVPAQALASQLELASRVRAAASQVDELIASGRARARRRLDDVHRRAMEATAALAAGAAHELNTPLAVISGRAQLLIGETADPRARASLSAVAAAAQSCSDIVSDLLAYAQPPPALPEAVELSDLVRGVISGAVEQGLLDASQARVDVADDCPPVWFDPRRLEAAMHELVRNAVEATDSATRRLTIKAAADLTEDRVVLRVRDNGRGMTPDVLGRACDPFFSHRRAGRGRGMGLARVCQWVRSGGGDVRLKSRAGQGAEVELRLPAAPRRET